MKDIRLTWLARVLSLSLGLLPLLPPEAWAQPGNTAGKAFTLDEAVQYALGKNETLQSQVLDETLAAKKADEIKADRLPMLNAAVDFRYNPVLQTSVLPGVLRGLPDDQTITAQFGTKLNLTAALDATYVTFDPTRATKLALTDLQAETSKLNVQKTAREVKLNVRKAYFAVLLQQLRLELAQTNLNQAQLFYEQGQKRFQYEKIVKYDLDKLYLTQQNRLAEVQRARQDVDKALLLLKFQMNYPLDDAISLADSTLLRSVMPGLPTAYVPKSFGNHPDVKLNSIKQVTDSLNIKVIRKEYLPTVSLYGNASIQALRNEFNFFDTQQRWFGISYLGVKVQANLFDGFKKKAKIQQVQIQQMQTALALQQLKDNLAYQAQNSYVSLKNAYDNLLIQNNNRQIAEDLSAATQERYKNGLASETDVQDVQIQLLETQTNYLIAVYDYVVALLDYECATLQD